MPGPLSSFVARRAAQSGIATPEQWLLTMLGGRRSATGQTVNAETALTNTAVWNAVRILSGAIAGLPLILYQRRPGGGKDRAVDHPLYRLLHDAPTDRLTSFEWREMLAGHLELRGNAYAVIDADRRGVVQALPPLHPDRITLVIAPDDTVWYRYQTRQGGMLTFREDEILHFRGFSSDGYVGKGTIEVAREAIGVALAAEEHTAKFYSNDATPGGVLKHKAKLSDQAYQRLKDSWEARFAGSGNAWKPAILEEGLEWQSLTMSRRDAQYIETRKFQIEEIARIFDLPPHMLKSMDRATFSNIEHQGIEFVIWSLRARLVRMEQRLNKALLLERERGTYFFEFLVDGLLRGDMKTRYDAYNVGRTGGWLSADEVREIENMNPLPNGQGSIYLQPLNMATPKSGAPGTKEPMPDGGDGPADGTGDGNGSAGDGEDEEDLHARLLAASIPVLTDALGRALRKELLASRRQLERSSDVTEFVAWHEAFWREHQATLTERLLPVLRMVTTAADGAGSEALARALVAAAVEREGGAARTAVTAAAAEGRDALLALFTAWESTRATDAAQRERTAILSTLSHRGPAHVAA
jgi:HK97 family phage portal protein